MPHILALTSNPLSTEPLRLDAEIREIRLELESAPNFVFEHRGAARPDDLLQLLETVRPDILHFSGHGMSSKQRGRSAIVMEDNAGNSQILPAATLGRIFEALECPPRCVFLNCCYSLQQVASIRPHVEAIVGAKGALDDDFASIFAAAFYRWLATDRTVGAAFDVAATQVSVAGGDTKCLVLHRRRGRNPRFFGRPELHAKFLKERGKLMASDEHYDILLWLEGAEDFATSVTYEICDDSFDETFWEITRKEDRQFMTYDFRSTGQVTIRNVVWTRDDRGIGVSSTLTEALRRHYGPNPSEPIREAISRLAKL